MKNKRKIVSFEPDPDVAEMLTRVKDKGLTLSSVLNQALRIFGPKAVREEALARAKELRELAESFRKADAPTVSLSE